MSYKVLALDIDGTLVHASRKQITPVCAQTLHRLQQQGVLIVVASGRAPHACAASVFGDFKPDYYTCVNGACILDKNRRPIHEDRLELYQLEALLDFAQKNEHVLSFSFDDCYYVYSGYEKYIEYYQKKWGAGSHLKDGSSHTRHLQSMPYGAFALMPYEATVEFSKMQPSLRFAASAKDAYDVYKVENHKAMGLSVLLEKLSISWAEVVAVGDGDNDVEMLETAGLGVAMGNASLSVQACAKYITGTVQDDGAVQAAIEIFK